MVHLRGGQSIRSQRDAGSRSTPPRDHSPKLGPRVEECRACFGANPRNETWGTSSHTLVMLLFELKIWAHHSTTWLRHNIGLDAAHSYSTKERKNKMIQQDDLSLHIYSSSPFELSDL